MTTNKEYNFIAWNKAQYAADLALEQIFKEAILDDIEGSDDIFIDSVSDKKIKSLISRKKYFEKKLSNL